MMSADIQMVVFMGYQCDIHGIFMVVFMGGIHGIQNWVCLKMVYTLQPGKWMTDIGRPRDLDGKSSTIAKWSPSPKIVDGLPYLIYI